MLTSVLRYRPREYETEDGPWDPISGGASALLGTIASLTMGIADMPVDLFKAFKSKSDTSSEGKTHQKTDSMSGTATSISRSESQTTLSAGRLSDEQKVSFDQLSGHTAVDSETMSVDSGNKPENSSMTCAPSVAPSIIDKPASMKTTLSSSNSREIRPGSRSCSPTRSREYEPSPELTLESAIGAGKGVSRIVGAGLKSPMDFTLGLARGFHNAPKLYGDDTVRPSEKVTDFQSGLKAAGKEFGYGFYDGISGLITQPLKGAEKEGAAGLIKGIGKGIGGLILKPGAGKYLIHVNLEFQEANYFSLSHLGPSWLHVYGYTQGDSQDIWIKCPELCYFSAYGTRLRCLEIVYSRRAC